MGNIFWNSFLSYDWIIFAFFIANLVIFFITIIFILHLKNLLYPRTDLASTKKYEFPKPNILTKDDVDKLKRFAIKQIQHIHYSVILLLYFLYLDY